MLYPTNNNAAYDIRNFEQYVHTPARELKVIRTRRLKTQVNLSASAKVMAVMAVFTVLLLVYLVYSFAILNELTAYTYKQKKELQALQSECTRLESALESKISIRNIEEVATRELGLGLMQKYQIEYINLSRGDRIEVIDLNAEPQLFDKFKVLLAAIVEYIPFSLNKN